MQRQSDNNFKANYSKGGKASSFDITPEIEWLSTETAKLFNLDIKPIEMALIVPSAEDWVGINCGIMDQFSSIMGLENKVIKIDCRTLDYTYHDADFANYSLLLFDSNLQHSLFTSEYNNRRIECAEGLSSVNDNYPEINSFRDCNEDLLIGLK